MTGLYFEELKVGDVFRHALRRTVTEADNTFFSALTMNPAALHLDEQYCKEHTEFGTRIVNSAFTLGLVVGISVGDTIHVESEVVEVRASKSRPDNGIVTFAHRGYNQRNEIVMTCKRSALMMRIPKA